MSARHDERGHDKRGYDALATTTTAVPCNVMMTLAVTHTATAATAVTCSTTVASMAAIARLGAEAPSSTTSGNRSHFFLCSS